MSKSKPAQTVLQARRLRREMSPPEIYLWQHFRQKADGIKIRRQHPFGPYILDYYCPQAKLAIEIDGISHEMGNNPARDSRRDAYLLDNGVETIRIAAADVMNDSSAVADAVLRMIKLHLSSPK